LTLIIGGICHDGVVLVGDTKITVDNGASYSYAKKIVSPSPEIVIATAGATGFGKTFQTRLILGIGKISKQKEKESVNLNEKLILLAEKIIREMVDTYGDENVARYIDSLIVFRSDLEPELIHLTGSGLPEPVNNYLSIGHGQPYGSFLLKTLWEKYTPMKMNQFAKIGCLTINYLQDLELDNSVGFEKNKTPQVYFIPSIPQDAYSGIKNDLEAKEIFNRYKIIELSEKDIKSLMKNSTKNIANIESTIKNIKV
jgi:20S proteasome alpha/beta subunit